MSFFLTLSIPFFIPYFSFFVVSLVSAQYRFVALVARLFSRIIRLPAACEAEAQATNKRAAEAGLKAQRRSFLDPSFILLGLSAQSPEASPDQLFNQLIWYRFPTCLY
jgi:hypothetical protein